MPIKPPPREKMEYERVKSNEWISGTIAEVEHDPMRKSSFKGTEKVGPMVRFKFALDGYQFPHYSRWMSLSYADKANLYKTFIVELVEDAKPYMDFDMELLRGLKIKTMWKAQGEFDNLFTICPLDKKVDPNGIPF